MAFGLLAVIATGVSWIISGIIMGKLPKVGIDTDAHLVIGSALNGIVGVAIGLFVGFSAGVPIRTIVLGLGILFVAGIVNNRQLVWMSKAMQVGPNGIIWSFLQCGFIIPFIFLSVCYHSEVTPFKVGGCIVLIAAMLIMGVTGKNNKESTGPWLMLTFLAFLVTGVSQTMTNIPSFFEGAERLDSSWKMAANGFGLAAGSLFFGLFEKPSPHVIRKTIASLNQKLFWWYIFIHHAPTILINFLLFYYGMDTLAKHGVGAIAFPLMTGSCIIAFDIYSMAVLHERRTPLQLFALLLCLLGIVGFCF